MEEFNYSNYLIPSHKPSKILSEVKKIFLYHYKQKEFNQVNNCYKQVYKLFNGKFNGYKACSTDYHDLHHTITAFLATMRLIDGYILSEEIIPVKLVTDVLTAALLHDIGYIQEINDKQGTGGKFTENHVLRSIEMFKKHFKEFKISEKDVSLISKFISCTELKINPNSITFFDEHEKTIGFMLATADILSQMSDREYLEKLMFLYKEFKEARIPGYNTEFDILKNTLNFYTTIKLRLQDTLKSKYKYSKVHFEKRVNIDKNLYIASINKNIAYLQTILDDNTTNFRKKLKRGNIIQIYDTLTPVNSK
jgi:hypothetical protein